MKIIEYDKAVKAAEESWGDYINPFYDGRPEDISRNISFGVKPERKELPPNHDYKVLVVPKEGSLGLRTPAGSNLINFVKDQSPAWAAGLHKGHVITEVD